MRVFVTGATGSHAVPALVAAGHQVSTLARSDTRAQQLKEQGATRCAHDEAMMRCS
jgi:uncharacterized protein YbjT (DUF2867 family)